MTLREALAKNIQDRITIQGFSYKVEAIDFSEKDLNTLVDVYKNQDIDTGKLYNVVACKIDNNYISFLID